MVVPDEGSFSPWAPGRIRREGNLLYGTLMLHQGHHLVLESAEIVYEGQGLVTVMRIVEDEE
jgi:hypothetical protein